MSYFRGPSQSFKGPNFLISLMGLITIALSPQNFAGPAGPFSVNFEGHWPEGPPYLNPGLRLKHHIVVQSMKVKYTAKALVLKVTPLVSIENHCKWVLNFNTIGVKCNIKIITPNTSLVLF